MKLQLSRKGFTLVEIMIVVVIIGLLAALAIPAFKKVRNTAVEKTIFNDARQVSSAANQYFTENSVNTITMDKLIGPGAYMASMSSGTLVKQATNTTNLTSTDLWTATGKLAAINVSTEQGNAANSIITLGNLGYDTTLSSSDNIKGATPKGGYAATGTGDNYLSFSVETGQLLRKGITPASAAAIY